MKKLLVLFSLILSFSSIAIELPDAKQQGLVGEQTNGLLGVVKSSAQVQALVKDINKQRLDKYLQIAQKNAMTVEKVSQLAGKKTINKTPIGQYIKNNAGKWVIK